MHAVLCAVLRCAVSCCVVLCRVDRPQVTLVVQCEDDLKRDVLKSDSAMVLIPELELELGITHRSTAQHTVMSFLLLKKGVLCKRLLKLELCDKLRNHKQFVFYFICL